MKAGRLILKNHAQDRHMKLEKDLDRLYLESLAQAREFIEAEGKSFFMVLLSLSGNAMVIKIEYGLN